jgi:hypothetical protein
LPTEAICVIGVISSKYHLALDGGEQHPGGLPGAEPPGTGSYVDTGQRSHQAVRRHCKVFEGVVPGGPAARAKARLDWLSLLRAAGDSFFRGWDRIQKLQRRDFGWNVAQSEDL